VGTAFFVPQTFPQKACCGMEWHEVEL